MLTMNEFISEMKAEIRDFLPEEVKKDIIIEDTTVFKINDQELHGLAFRMPGSNAAPTMYVDEMYAAYKTGADIIDLARDMAARYSLTNMPAPPEMDLSYEKVKSKLTVRLLEKKRNHGFLATMPYMNAGNGLVLVADINMDAEGDNEWRIAINNSLMATFEIDKDSMFKDAIENASRYCPATLVDMSSALFSPDKENLLDRNEPIAPDNIGGMYVLSNSTGSFGASCLFYPGVKEKAAMLLGDYYVLPSSLHEVILVPDAAGIDEKELCRMVKDANRSVVEPHEILSDNVYHYSRSDGRLEKVSGLRRDVA